MEIVKSDHKALSSISKGVAVGFDIAGVVDEMWKVMIKGKGCGLAANQVGLEHRIIMINTDGFSGEVINPILSNGRFEKNSKEGCLSFPGMLVTKKRFNRITIEGFDRNWNPIKKNLKALSAFCAQHEVDHLNGITINDKVGKHGK